jgi:hypothetical protein
VRSNSDDMNIPSDATCFPDGRDLSGAKVENK